MKYLFVCIVFMSTQLFAVDATIKIEKDVEDRTRIALVDASTTKNNMLFKVLLSDLKISGHFIADSTYNKGTFDGAYIAPVLKSKEYVLKYNLHVAGTTKLEIKLIKASNSTEIYKNSYKIATASKLPFLAHKAIADINKVLKYPSISWINRYVVYAVYSSPKHSEIRLADYTLSYKKTIIKGGLNLFPKWADDKQKSFYYTSYNELVPTLYKINIYTGAKSKLVSSEGMMVCSDVSKDGTKLLVTMAGDGQPDIYEFNTRSKVKKRVTTFKGIDVGAKYINNENGVIFVSNRLGYANIFKKAINGSAASQVVHHGRNNNACDTHENKIVYSSRESASAFGGNTFNLYLNGDGDTRPLTSTGANQFPRFSADGSVVLFLKQKGRSTSIGYTNVISNQSLLFPFNDKKVQSIDW
jgi:TolB protein